MNYIEQINCFYVWLVENPISGNAQALWHRLLAYCNVFGWKDDFTITNSRLIEELNISRQELDRIRNVLVQRGRIQYEKGVGNRCGIYTMIPFVSQKTNDCVTQTGHKPDTNRTQPDTQTGPLNKLNKTKRENNNTPIPPKDDLDIFADDLKQAIEDWFSYKAERREAYKPTGRKSLITTIKNNAEKHGNKAVIDVIQRSMGANYKGIIWDWLTKKEMGKGTKLNSLDYGQRDYSDEKELDIFDIK